MSRHGGIPLQKLPAKKRRQLTSHGKGNRSANGPAHQGSKEMQRRARQLARSQQ
jgi:hypothetical protein